MTPAQRTALANPCLLAEETIYRSFASLLPGGLMSQVLTVNRGYE